MTYLEILPQSNEHVLDYYWESVYDEHVRQYRNLPVVNLFYRIRKMHPTIDITTT